MSPVRSFEWKSSDFYVKRFAQALVLQTATQAVQVKSAYVPGGLSGQHSFQFL